MGIVASNACTAERYDGTHDRLCMISLCAMNIPTVLSVLSISLAICISDNTRKQLFPLP